MRMNPYAATLESTALNTATTGIGIARYPSGSHPCTGKAGHSYQEGRGEEQEDPLLRAGGQADAHEIEESAKLNFGRGRDLMVTSLELIVRSAASQAKAPRATMTRTRRNAASSRTRYGAQLSRSTFVGRFIGGAQRTAAAT